MKAKSTRTEVVKGGFFFFCSRCGKHNFFLVLHFQMILVINLTVEGLINNAKCSS